MSSVNVNYFDTLSSRILISDLHKNTQDDFFMKLDMLKNNKEKIIQKKM